MLTMRAVVLAFVCLVCLAYARRVQTTSEEKQDRVYERHQAIDTGIAQSSDTLKQRREKNRDHHSLKAMQRLLLTFQDASAGWRGARKGLSSAVRSKKRIGVRRSSPDARAAGPMSQLLRIRGGSEHHILNAASVNPLVKDMQYAVRGAIPDRAQEIDALIEANPKGHGFAFEKTTQCNIGNPQALGQHPLSFNRQVLSLVSNPDLLELAEADSKKRNGLFKADAIRRARKYLDRIPSGVGAYTHSMGFPIVRAEVADFISKRDGHPCSPDDIFITDGASAGVHMAFNVMIRPGGNDGVLIPIPQYPLYSALTTLSDGKLVGYYLDEGCNWGITVQELRRALAEARTQGTLVRGLVVINPGNPTGQCLDAAEMREIINFCEEEKLVLLADEVYQENVYAQGKQFTSFRKVAMDMDADVELISFHSASKGFVGECGLRGGYMELHNISPDVKAMLYKLASVELCSNTCGQITIGLMVNPPAPGDESYPTYVEERDAILASLNRRATKLADALNNLEGVTCNPAEGAMYVFPQVHLPRKAILAAKKASMAPDTFYCLRLLEATGIATVPGSGFKQKTGTFHFRTTFLPSEEAMDMVTQRITQFHADFMKQFA